MNIFMLDSDPTTAALMHCDQHVVKMPIESTQMLSDAHHVLSAELPSGSFPICDSFNPNHGCSLWAQASKANYIWLYRLFLALCDEYTYRYGGFHESKLLKQALATPPQNIPDIGLTPAYQAMPEEYKSSNDVTAYRTYYLQDKTFARWTRRSPPHWWNDKHTYPDNLRQKRLRARSRFCLGIKHGSP